MSAFAFVIPGLISLKDAGYDTVLIPRIHPKMDTQGGKSGYIDMFYEQIKTVESLGVKFVRADKEKLEELCLAADITCGCFTGGVTIGAKLGKPTIHLFTANERKQAEDTFSLRYPYMPEIIHGAAVGVFSIEDVEKTFPSVLETEIIEQIKINSKELLQDNGKSAENIAEFIMNL